MASIRAAAISLLAAAALSMIFVPARTALAQTDQNVVALVVMPEEEALKVFASHPFALGLGVYPESRDASQFVTELGYASPRASGRDGVRTRLADVIRSLDSQVFVGPGPDSNLIRTLTELFRPSLDARISTRRILEISAPPDAETFDRVGLPARDSVILVSIGERTPVLVGVCDSPCRLRGPPSGILTGSITRRPGIVTPYDIGATILDRLDISRQPPSVAGDPLRRESADDPAERLDSLARRLERDDSYAPGLAATTVTLGVVTISLSYGLFRRGRREAALRVAQGAVFILPGWALSLFVPTGRWQLRGLVVLGGVLFGASLRIRQPLRTMAKVGLVSALAFLVLNAVASLNPGGEPGLSIWANPLVSWRFFGLANVPAAIIASGVVIWGVLAGLTLPVFAVLSVLAAVVTGAPTVGANFVGVLTFAFGAAAVTIALQRRRTNLSQVAIAGVISVAAFALALLADAGSPVSHGGRAAQKISSGGLSAAWDLIEGRLRLNWELIRDFTGGVLWVIGLVISLGVLINWGLHTEKGPFPGRVAVLGGALMAFASLVLEDSGFYSGAVLWFVTADAWLLIALAGEGSGVSPPDPDAPFAGVGAGTKPPQPGAARRPRSSPD